jgi:hypothetical protein
MGRKVLFQPQEFTAMKHTLVATSALTLLLGVAGFAGGKDPGDKGPRYDPAKETTISTTVVEVREVSSEGPLEGIHLDVKMKGETLEVYVGPADFVKLFGVTFNKGDDIDVTGSKVTVDGGVILLGREIRLGHVTLLLRDKDGKPFWGKWERIPTGL